MENLQLRLKNEILSVIFKVANGIWPKVLLIIIIQTLLTMFLFRPLYSKLLGIDPAAFQNMGAGGDLQMMQSQIAEMQYALTQVSVGAIGLMFLLGLVGIVISCFIYVLVLRLAKAKMKGVNLSIEEWFQDVFSANVLKMTGSYIIMIIIYILCLILAGFVLGSLISPIMSPMAFIALTLIATFFISALILRFILSFPKIEYHNEGAISSLGYSWKKISYGKGLKYTAIAILAFIIMVIALLIVTSIFGLITGNPTFLEILGQVLGALMGSYIMALTVSTMASLFFRAEGISEEDGFQIEDHLISEE